MADTHVVFLTKVKESLAGAESEFANQRYNNCANRLFVETIAREGKSE